MKKKNYEEKSLAYTWCDSANTQLVWMKRSFSDQQSSGFS